jgi:dephospho-CoA kinase
MRRLAARMIVIGIVGSPAGGKSTVAAHLQGLGATWVNADQIARDVLERAEVQTQLIDHFGVEITDNAGRIDRTQLAQRVFGDDDAHRAALNYLESVVHPQTRGVITERLKQAADQGAVAAILDVPLLFETGWDRCCDEIWCVDSSHDRRRQRTAARGWSEGELARREENQLAIAEKRRLSNWVIANDGSLQQLTETIDRRWSSLLSRQALPTTNPRCPSALL